jgi:hypothetical protein
MGRRNVNIYTSGLYIDNKLIPSGDYTVIMVHNRYDAASVFSRMLQGMDANWMLAVHQNNIGCLLTAYVTQIRAYTTNKLLFKAM